MRRLASGTAAGLVVPLVNPAHPVYAHFLRGELSDFPERLPQASGESPAEAAQSDSAPHWLFLSADQAAVFVPLAEAIIPGSSAAQVGPFVDLLLSVESKQHQQGFLASVEAVDAEAIRQFGAGFPKLSEAHRHELLERLSQTTWAPARQPPGLREHFENLKEWVTGAYYSSEIGMLELGWTGNRVFDEFPACEHSSHSGGGL